MCTVIVTTRFSIIKEWNFYSTVLYLSSLCAFLKTSGGIVLESYGLILMEDFHLNEIEKKAHYRNGKHKVAVYHWRNIEPLSGFTEKEDSHDPNWGKRNNRADNFRSVPSKSKRLVGLFLWDFDSVDWNQEPNNIRRQMSGISEDSDRACKISANELSDYEECRNEACQVQLLLGYSVILWHLLKSAF